MSVYGRRSALGPAAALAAALFAVGCSGVTPRAEGPEFSTFDPKIQRQRDQYGTITGTDGFTLWGSTERQRKADRAAAGAGTGLGVNAFLWRASLETVDFMPLASADPFGGLIITDWYEPAEAQGERFKLNILIRDTALRADGVKVSVFRQVKGRDGQWVDADVAPGLGTSLEDQILTRARELRIVGLEQG